MRTIIHMTEYIRDQRAGRKGSMDMIFLKDYQNDREPISPNIESINNNVLAHKLDQNRLCRGDFLYLKLISSCQRRGYARPHCAKTLFVPYI